MAICFFLMVVCVVVSGHSSSNSIANSTSLPVAECPIAANWTGLDAKSCVAEQCKDNLECSRTGVQGFCCKTSCSGHNCFYNATQPQKPDRSSSECPHHWQGYKCRHNTCSMDHQCMTGGMEGYCCPTRCGKHNCYTPSVEKRSVHEDCDPDWDECEWRRKRSSHECPSNWQGSKCGRNMCSMDQQCMQHGKKGYCCPTKCGKKNCYMKDESRTPVPLTLADF